MRKALSNLAKTKRGIDKSAAIYYSVYNGKDREEYTKTAVRERKRKLRVSFGKGLWNVALEPERRKLLRKFRESPGKRPRLIPVNGSDAKISALLSEK